LSRIAAAGGGQRGKEVIELLLGRVAVAVTLLAVLLGVTRPGDRRALEALRDLGDMTLHHPEDGLGDTSADRPRAFLVIRFVRHAARIIRRTGRVAPVAAVEMLPGSWRRRLDAGGGRQQEATYRHGQQCFHETPPLLHVRCLSEPCTALCVPRAKEVRRHHPSEWGLQPVTRRSARSRYDRSLVR